MATSISERVEPSKSLLVDQEASAVAFGPHSYPGPPPAKKRRLKLNPPRPIASPEDTIAVSRVKRLSSTRINRRSEIDGEQTEIFGGSNERSEKSPTVLNADHVNEVDQVRSGPTDEEDAPVTTAPADYGDFMSYYITGNDDSDPNKANAVSKSKSRKQTSQKRKSRSKPGESTPSAENQHPSADRTDGDISTPSRPAGASERRSRTKPIRPIPLDVSSNAKTLQDSLVTASPGHTSHDRQAPADVTGQTACRPYVHRRPVLQWIDIVPATRPSRPSTLFEMIEKVNYLSSALAGMGGYVTQDQVPSQMSTDVVAPPSSVDKPPSTDREDHEPAGRSDVSLDELGSDDEPLVHGIHFIQNALRSWAQQRLSNEAFHQMHMQAQQHATATGHHTAREPTEPAASGEEILVVTCDLAATPEGVTIKAFQEVLDSGCLRLNLMIPLELSSALRRLYVQIDHLINQDQRNPIPWQCMSYNAQLAAHQKRAGIWQAARSRAQEELTRQQQMIDSQLMAQLNSTDRLAALSSTALGRPQHKHGVSAALRKSLPNGNASSPHGHSGLTAIGSKSHQASPASQRSTPSAAATLHRPPNMAPVRNTENHLDASPEIVHDGHSSVEKSLTKRPARVRLSVTKPGDSNELPFEIYSSDAIAPQQSANITIATRDRSRLARSLSSDNPTAAPAKKDPALASEKKRSSGKLPRHPLKSPMSVAETGASPKTVDVLFTPSKETRKLSPPKGTSMASTVPLENDSPGTALAQSPKEEETDRLPIVSPQLGRSMRIRRSSRKYEESKNSET
jgi:hypothetical protein